MPCFTFLLHPCEVTLSLALSLCPEVPTSPLQQASLQPPALLGPELTKGGGLSRGWLSARDPSTPKRGSSRPIQGSLRDERIFGDSPRFPVPLSEVEVLFRASAYRAFPWSQGGPPGDAHSTLHPQSLMGRVPFKTD